MERIISPSILSADFAHLADDVKRVTDAGAKYVHIDVMDGHFVPNLSMGPCVIKSLRKTSEAFFDVHLMIENPEKYIKSFADSGADLINFHYEATDNPEHLINLIKSQGKKVGITIKPDTPVDVLFPFINMVDMVLIMTVYPGFGGQTLIAECLDKIKVLRLKYPELDIEIDGGVNLENIKTVIDSGANIIVAGNAVFGAEYPQNVIKEMLLC